jgi:hypothetical protein
MSDLASDRAEALKLDKKRHPICGQFPQIYGPKVAYFL